MEKPAIPANEAQRLGALRGLGLLDTPAEARFDRITRIAKAHFGVPIVLVSLVDADRQWFKSRQGLAAPETPRDISFCGHAVLQDDVFVVPNALEDRRFADNPLVLGAPAIRFYAGAPLRGADGMRLGTLCIIDQVPRDLSVGQCAMLRDLADLVEAELERTHLVAAERDVRQFKATLDQTMDCVFMFWPDTLQFFYVNAGATKQLDYTLDDLIGMTPLEIKPDFDEDRFKEMITPLIKGPERSITFETVHLTKHGRRIPVEIFLQYVAPDDEAPRFVAIVRDISERKQAERMKREFVSTVSHELRTPLTSIKGALGLIKTGAVAAQPDAMTKMLDIAYNNSDRLVHLINDILDIEKIEAGKMDFDMGAVALGPLLAEAIEANKAFGAQYGVRFVLTGADDTARVWGDRHRLMQVLNNLLSNAAKFSPEGETVTVTLATRADGFRVSVADNGPGIPPEFVDRVFQKFSQADASTTREKGGTGLGLSIAKAIVEHHRGTIGFTTGPNAGAVFYVDLPAYARDGAEAYPDAAAPCTARVFGVRG